MSDAFPYPSPGSGNPGDLLQTSTAEIPKVFSHYCYWTATRTSCVVNSIKRRGIGVTQGAKRRRWAWKTGRSACARFDASSTTEAPYRRNREEEDRQALPLRAERSARFHTARQKERIRKSSENSREDTARARVQL
ncbi:hypothetical protein THAOC_28405 [Thalassiosira oceanica]|uniref:Uncharacterized protein n=1 Tax=Thalassiosira oceanica TaxID=159749 RepID=K0RF45_THAOC|nr:hypothetical protein THAOC_28405 [Thalassiosira oceanica]|eukprot:EJK52333.1 hypothetical protein THAOC_28405 [Thalassiosira oceanica]